MFNTNKKLCSAMNDLLQTSAVVPIFSAILASLSLHSAGQDLNESRASTERESKPVIEEVIVTANFRSQSIQDVAGSIAGFDQNKIKELAAENIGDLAKFTPSLSNNDRGPGRNDMNIRGMGRLAVFSDAVPTTNPVGMYLDDVSLNTATSSQADVDFFGIQRIEVLRGPQGTLYGESAEGGAVRFISQEPDLSGFGGTIELEGHDGHSADLRGSGRILLNIPIIQNRFGAVISANYTRQSGFIDNIREHRKNINDSERENYRVAFLADITEKLTAKLTVHKYRLEYGAAYMVDTADEPKPKTSFKTSDDIHVEKLLLVPLKVTYKFDLFALESITGYYSRDVYSNAYNSFAAAFASLITAPQGFMADGHVDVTITWEQRSQELRYISDWDSKFGLVGGIYYRTSEYDTEGVGYSKDLPNIDIFSGGSVFQKTRQLSYYAELSWDITDSWSVTAGARRHKETLKTDGEEISLFSPNPDGDFLRTGIELPVETGPLNIVTLPGLVHEFDVSDWLPMVRVQYQPNDKHLYYFRYATGLRSGNTNVPLTLFLNAIQSGNPNEFGPDNPDNFYLNDFVVAYEVGMKMTFLDGSWILNAALFYNDWDNLQVITTRGVTANAGKARSVGAEIESVLHVTEHLQMFVGASRIEAEITEGFDSGSNDRVEPGSPIPFVQKNSFSAGVSYNYTWNNGIKIRPTLSYSYTGEYHQFILGSNSDQDTGRSGKFGLFNFSVNTSWREWGANFSVNNLFNKAVYINQQPHTETFEQTFRMSAPENIDENYMNIPRTMKLTLSYNF